MNHGIFETIKLDEECEIYISNTVDELNLDHSTFLQLWNLHPKDYHKIKMYGKEIYNTEVATSLREKLQLHRFNK